MAQIGNNIETNVARYNGIMRVTHGGTPLTLLANESDSHYIRFFVESQREKGAVVSD